MEYYFGSTSVIDDLYFADGTSELNVAGGAGIYALAGARLWASNVHLSCGVGKDYNELFGQWYLNNNIDMSSLRYVDDFTPITNVYYQSDGEREEIPKYGLEHYKKFEFTKHDFLELLQREIGLYIFRNIEDSFWEPVLKVTDRKAKVMWEIAEDACKPELLSKVETVLPLVDVLSINLSEAKKLFDMQDEEKIIAKLASYKLPLVFLRVGKKGQHFIQNGQSEFVSSITSDLVVDVTGGGNSSSGAVLIGFCENKSLKEIGRMANLSAIMCLSQHGVPKNIHKFKK